MTPTRLGPVIEMPELDPEDGCLERVQSFAVPDLVMLVLGHPTVVAELPDLPEQRRITGHRPGVAVGAEVLAGVEAEAGQIADTAAGPVAIARPVRLCSVLDQAEPVAPADLPQRVQSAGRP